MTPDTHDALLAAALESLGDLPDEEREDVEEELRKLGGVVGEMASRNIERRHSKQERTAQ